MIPPELRHRLEEFICDHIACKDADCVLKAAQNWVKDMTRRGHPEHEMLLFGLAYQAFLARDRMAKQKIGGYEAAFSTLVAERAMREKAPVIKLVR